MTVPRRKPRLALFRPAEKLAASVRLAEERGYEVMAVPLLETKPLDEHSFAAFVGGLRSRAVDVVVFTSALGVTYAFRASRMDTEQFRDALNRARVIAIGPATQFELEGFGVESESPSQASSRGLVEHFERNRIAAKRVVLVRSRQGGAELPDGLRSLGYDVLDVPVYDVGPPEDRAGTKSFFDRVVRGDVDVYAFLSSMTVHNFLELAAALGVEDRARVSLSRATVAAIGGPTKNALEKEGIRVTVEPSRATFSDLLDALDHAAKRTNV